MAKKAENSARYMAPVRMIAPTAVRWKRRWTSRDERFLCVVAVTIQLRGDGFVPKSIITWSVSIILNDCSTRCIVLGQKAAACSSASHGMKLLLRSHHVGATLLPIM